MINLTKRLKEKFNYDGFKAGQKETIESVIERRNTLGVLPTGTGKSLCYQLASEYFEGPTLVVSPLLSLMEDQVQELKAQGEKSVIAINSQLSYGEKEWALANLNQFNFVFFSPETLLQEGTRKVLAHLKINFFVVDEAHCISQWGIDFRPEYEQLYQVIKELKYPTVLALTATATEAVTTDIIAKLFNKEAPVIVRESVNRENIAYEVVTLTDKLAYLKNFLAENGGPGIVYFSSKKQAVAISRQLNAETTLRAAFYHGDLTNQERSLIQQQFLSDQLDVLCATSAFGMGINKKNVRFVIHYHLPSSIEAYLQESGRAGRDGQPSLAVLLYEKKMK